MHSKIHPLILGVVLLALATLPSRSGERYWERLPDPSGTRTPLSQVGMDVDGGVWTVTGNRCHFWDQQKRRWQTILLEGKHYQVTLHGSQRTGLYASVVNADTRVGSIHRLRNGRAEKVADYVHDRKFQGVRLQVTRNGRLLNLTRDRIRLQVAGEWREWEARPLGSHGFTISDLGDTLLVPAGSEVCIIDASGQMTKVKPAEGVALNGIGAAWGKDHAIVSLGGQQLGACRTPGLEASNMDAANKLVGGYGRIADLFASSDGSAWVLSGDFRQRLWGLYRIAPGGTAVPIKGTLGLPWGRGYCSNHPRSIAMDRAGTMWLANGCTSVLRVKDGEVHPFDPRTDGSPETAMELVLSPEGMVYVAAKEGFYVYNTGTSITGLPQPSPVPCCTLGEELWSVEPEPGMELAACWPAGDVDVLLMAPPFSKGKLHKALVVDTATGKTRFALRLPPQGNSPLNVCRGRGLNELLASTKTAIFTIDPATGEATGEIPLHGAIQTVPAPHRSARISWWPPYPVGKDRLILSYWGRWLCLKKTGEVAWQQAIPRHPVGQPAMNGDQMVIQSPDKEGMGSLQSIDARTGAMEWQVKTASDGMGAMFTEDGEGLVTVGVEYGRGVRHGELALHAAKDGRRIWGYRRSGADLSHLPLINSGANTVHAYFNNGSLVCLNLADGKLVWETRLPRGPFRTQNRLLPKYSCPLSAGNDVLLATDCAGTVTALKPATGDVLVRFAPIDAISSDGARTGMVVLKGMPRLVGDQLLIPSSSGLHAYRFTPDTYARPAQSPRLVTVERPPAVLTSRAAAITVAGSGGTGKLTLMYRRGREAWQREPLSSPNHTITFTMLADGAHHVRLAVVDENGRSSKRIFCQFRVELPPEIVTRELLAEHDSRSWERFPLPPDGTRGTKHVAIDANNDLWMVAGKGCYSWDRNEKRWFEVALGEGGYQRNFLGTRESGLYIAEFPLRGPDGTLYHLLAGEATRITAVTRGNNDPHNGLHITKDGRIINWTRDRLRVRANGKWEEWKADLQWHGPLFELGQTISLYRNGVLHVVDGENRLTSVPVEEGKGDCFGALLGKDTALISCLSSTKPLYAFHVPSGKPVDLDRAAKAFRWGTHIRKLLPVPGGSVLALVESGRSKDKKGVFHRIALDGAVSKETAMIGLPPYRGIGYQRRHMLPENSSRTWFTYGTLGVSCVDNNRFLQFDDRKDGSPFNATEMALDADGILYVAGDDHLYAYNKGTPLFEEPLPKPGPLTAWAREAWKIEMPEGSYLRDPKRVGDMAFLRARSGEKEEMRAVDLGTGRACFTIPLPRGTHLTMGPGRNANELIACHDGRLLCLQASTGKTIGTIPTEGDHWRGMPPLPVLQNRLFLWTSGSSPACTSPTGERVWAYEGQGRHHSLVHRSAIAGDRLLVQTVSRDRLNGTSVALDLETGEPLWAAASQGQPQGVLAIADGKYAVGIRSIGGKEAAEVRLICRSTQTGRTLWQHSRAPATLSQPAIYDHATDCLCAYFDDGTILCLEGTTGKVAWDIQRPESPRGRATANSPSPGNHHCLSLAPELLLATDRTSELSVFSIHTGEALAHFALGKSVVSRGKTAEQLRPLTGPWLVKDKLVVVNSRGIHAYPFPLAALAKAALATKPKTEAKQKAPPAAEVAAPPAPAPDRYWERFPMPVECPWPVAHVGLDANQGLWIVAGGNCHYWDKTRKGWVTVTLPIVSAFGLSKCTTQLHSTSGTDLYLTQAGDKPGTEGQVYRLLGGRADRITTFQHAGSNGPSNFRVSRNGRLFNWTLKKLRVYDNAVWKEWDVEFTKWPLPFFDTGDTVCLRHDRTFYVFNKRSELTRRMVDDALPRRAYRGVVWGKEAAIVGSGHELGAFHIPTGKPISLPLAIKATVARRIGYFLPLPDGSVLAMAWQDKQGHAPLCRISLDGTVRMLQGTGELPSFSPGFNRRPRSMHAESADKVWFANTRAGIVRLENGKAHTFRPRTDGSPYKASEIVIASDGVVYAVGDGRLYAYNKGASVTGPPLPKPRSMSPLGNPVWATQLGEEVKIDSVWPARDLALLCLSSAKDRAFRKISAVDLASGEERFSFGVSGRSWPVRSIQPGHGDGELLLAFRDSIGITSASTGKTIRSISSPTVPRGHPYSIWPIAGRQFFVVSQDFACLGGKNEVIWRQRRARGGHAAPPGIEGMLLIIQSDHRRQNGKIVQAIDLASGEALWSQPSEILGFGLAFTKDERHFVEGGTLTTNEKAEGRLVCRNSEDGEVQWEHRRSGAMLTHAPVIDRIAGRAYAYFGDGAVLCLQVETGKTIWETVLPHPPTKLDAVPEPGLPASLQLQPGVLLATDRTGTLTLLSPANGKALARFALAEDILHNGKRVGQEELVAAPWVANDMLIVPTREGLRAYRSPTTTYQPQGMPKLAWTEVPLKRSETDGIAVSVTATGGEGGLTIWYRCDDGEWQQKPFVSSPHAVELRSLPNGPHHLRIRAFDGRGLATKELSHEFEIAIDHGERIKELVIQLGAKRLRDRKAAKAGLLAMGDVVIPYLEKQRDHPDPEIRHEVREILKALRGADR